MNTTPAKAEFSSIDQLWADQTTIYWFELFGRHYGTDVEFEGEVYGLAESPEGTSILTGDGYPLTEGDVVTMAVRSTIEPLVTDELRHSTI